MNNEPTSNTFDDDITKTTSDSVTIAEPVKEPSNTAKAYDFLESAVNNLDMEVKKITEKLESVLRPNDEPLKEDIVNEPQPLEAPLARALNTLADRITKIKNTINNLNSRCDL